MPTDPTIKRILSRTPLYTKVSVSKVFDLAEEVNAALERIGRSPEWLASEMDISLEELTGLLSGMESFYDPIARMEAAFKADLFVGATFGKRYFKNDAAFSSEVKPNSVANIQKPVQVLPLDAQGYSGVSVWHSEVSLYNTKPDTGKGFTRRGERVSNILYVSVS